MHSRTYGATYDAVYKFLLENTGAIEGRIQERIKKWDSETMDDDVKKNIFVIFSENNIYYKLDIHPKNPALIQAVDDYVATMHEDFRDIVKNNEHKQERERQQQYERTKVSARESLLIAAGLRSNIITRPAARRMNWLKDLTQADFDRIYTEYENAYLEQHPEQLQQKAKQDTYMDKMKRFVIEHANDELPSVQQFINISSGWGAYPDYMKDEQKQVKTDPLHGSLGIIDRVIRTIRDMAYNMHVGNITPRIMNEIVRQYNNAPHKTLSKYAGFLVSPKMPQEDQQLEEFIVRRICQENYNIMSRKGFSIPKGTKMKVYNTTDKMLKRRTVIQPGEFTVDGFNRGLYKVVSDKNNI